MKTEKKIKIFYVGTWKSTRLGTREDTVNKTKAGGSEAVENHTNGRTR